MYHVFTKKKKSLVLVFFCQGPAPYHRRTHGHFLFAFFGVLVPLLSKQWFQCIPNRMHVLYPFTSPTSMLCPIYDVLVYLSVRQVWYLFPFAPHPTTQLFCNISVFLSIRRPASAGSRRRCWRRATLAPPPLPSGGGAGSPPPLPPR